MIHAVLGELISVEPNEVVIRTGGGVEYQLTVSNQTASKLSQLSGEAKKSVRLLSWLQHRDDTMTLYGFSDEDERLLFSQLITVNGIGPKQATKILSSVQVQAFVKALDESDLTYLSTIPGVGPKTSQKIVLALRDKVILDFDRPRKGELSSALIDKRYEELVASLSNMGYDKRHIIEALQGLLEEHAQLLEGQSFRQREEFLFKNLLIRLG